MPLRAQLRTGVLLWGFGNAVSRVLRFIAQYVLLWLLVPADFGLVAMTTALMNVLLMVSEFGIGVAVIQKKELCAGYVHTAFWINLAASMFILAVTWIAAPWVAAFYGADEITWLVRVTSLSFPINALRTIPTSLLRRRLQFGINSALETAWNGTSGMLMVVFAWCGATYWSLVIPAGLVGLLMTPLWFKYAEWRPAFTFDRAVLPGLLHYAKHLVGASLLALILSNAGFVIAGHTLGKDAAGLFNVATTYSMAVLIHYAYLIGNVSLSGFSAKQDDHEALRGGFLRLYELLTATTLPFHVLGIVLAPLLFSAFMPVEYGPALRCFQLLLAFAAVRCVTAHVAPFYNAVNRAHINFYFYLVSTPICVAIMYVACQRGFEAGGTLGGLNALAWATALTQGGSALAMLVVARFVLGWQRMDFVRRATPFLGAAMVSALAAWGLRIALDGMTFGLPLRAADSIVLALAGAAGLAANILTLYAFARPALATILHDSLPQGIRERTIYRWLPGLRHSSTRQPR
jgi:O-antigen/teichoic acid export membrane protein